MYDGTPYTDGNGAEAGYAAATRTVETGRAAEAKIFAQVIAALNAGQAKRKHSGEIAPLAEAIHKNNQLWVTLAADVGLPSNELPSQLRGQILNLAAFTLKFSNQVLIGEADVAPLVKINTSIMRGLQGKTGEDNEEGAT